jgi:MFS family permease
VGWGAAAILFAVVYMLVPEALAWRVLFWIGILPALLVLYIRRNVQEPEVFQATRTRIAQTGSSFLEIFSPALLRTTLLAGLMTTGMMAGYYAVTTWLPTYLKTVRHLSVLGTGWYTLVIILGSFVGYLVAAYLADFIGRRKTFLIYAVATGVTAVLYTLLPITDGMMLLLGFPLGFFLSGNFSGMGPFLTELYPSRVRGSGQGFVYNVGRGCGAFAPPLVGELSKTLSLSQSIGLVTGVAFAVVVLIVGFLPETRGKELLAYD